MNNSYLVLQIVSEICIIMTFYINEWLGISNKTITISEWMIKN